MFVAAPTHRPSFARRVWRWHFWAGLVVCPALIVVALSGGSYVFRDEVEDAWFADTTFVAPAGETKPPSEQLAAVLAVYPGRFVSRMTLAADPTRATTVLVNQPPRPDGADPGPSDLVSVDPYTARVLGERSNRSPVFRPMLDIHRRLFADTPGRWLVELTTSWTLVLLATGVWLWVPRTWRRVRGFGCRGWPAASTPYYATGTPSAGCTSLPRSGYSPSPACCTGWVRSGCGTRPPAGRPPRRTRTSSARPSRPCRRRRCRRCRWTCRWPRPGSGGRAARSTCCCRGSRPTPTS